MDFDDLDDADNAKLHCVASLDNAGVPRGECSCCDCLEWHSPDDAGSTKLRSHAYNVTRRLEATSAGRKGTNLCVIAQEGAAPADAFAADYSVEYSSHCARCGCHAMWHEDISDRTSRLSVQGLLVEVQEGWSDLERAVFLQTSGAFQPALEQRRSPPAPKPASGKAQVLVSVVCPTSPQRRDFHPSLYHCFCQQKHSCKELVVVETGGDCAPSLCFSAGAAANDPRVTYRYFDDSSCPWSIGTKRNVACFLAAGEVIVHFDDDDLYAPGYLGLMVRALELGSGGKPAPGVEVQLAEEESAKPMQRLAQEEPKPAGKRAAKTAAKPALPCSDSPAKESADGESPPAAPLQHGDILAAALVASPGVSLDTYLALGSSADPNPPLRGGSAFLAEAVTFSSWYTFEVASGSFGICDVDNDHSRRQAWLLGYGFSFAYLREAWCAHWFRDVNLGEDCDFFEALLARNARVLLLRDAVGFCAHTHHDANFSPWEKVRELPLAEVSAPLRDLAAHLGSGLKIAKGRKPPETKAVKLTPETATALQDELIAEMTKEHFQRKLHMSWKKNKKDPTKQMQERSLICLEVQGPILERYGFPGTMEGVMMSVKAYTPEINAVPGMDKKNFLIHWLCKPEMQAKTPIDKEVISDLVANITKSAKIRRRRR